jgi:peptidoglycan/xylan/chitin deacetylase (PgdA/CDA1 family)
MYYFISFLISYCLANTLFALPVLSLKPQKGSVALTFDDGPDPKHTQEVLDILKKQGVKATFFMCGDAAQRYPELVKAVQKDGHVIANHTFSHPNLAHLSLNKVTWEIQHTNDILKQITGEAPKCLRPPFGALNKQVHIVASEQNLAVVTWDLNSFDYTGETPEKETQWVLEKAKAGSVILMHDSHRGGARTALALTGIIEAYKKRGIGFDTICKN